MSAWQPSAQGLTDLLNLLREAINPTDGHNVQQVKPSKFTLLTTVVINLFIRNSSISTKFLIITIIWFTF